MTSLRNFLSRASYKSQRIVCRSAFKIFRPIFSQDAVNSVNYKPLYEFRECLPPDVASNAIAKFIESRSPAMVARFGSGECGIMRTFRSKTTRSTEENILAYLNNQEVPWYTKRQRATISGGAGLFSNSPKELDQFSELMIDCCKDVDLLGSWVPWESMFAEELKAAKICRLPDLEPYYHQKPWSKALKGKRVLVIHPFSETIRHQYEKKNLLFSDQSVLPDFELITLRAIQSAVGEQSGFRTWFDALDFMTNKAQSIDFDVAIIGCGAYGFPLAARIKRSGRQAIHLGGATQILFGIRGRRWDKHPRISKLYNDNWVRPGSDETPTRYKDLEGAAYW